jgi:hypothetical protein
MTPSIPRTLLLVILPLAAGTSGCVTAETWRVAATPTLGGPSLKGVLLSPEGKPHAAVVEYGAQWSYDLPLARDLLALVPLRDDGEPAPPFGYAGTQRQPERIVDDMGEAGRRQVLAGSFDWVWGGAADEVLKSPHFCPAVTLREPAGEFWVDDQPHKQFVIFGFGRTTDGPRPEPAPYGGPLQQSARILVLPAAAPRPDRQRPAALWDAAARMPMTLAVDAATPALFVMSLVGIVPPP